MTSTAPRRVAFYSHDTQGLGHIRRNIVLAAAIVAAEPDTDVLLITGNPEAATLPLPPNTDIATLPTIRKDSSGAYATRAMSSSLELVLDVRASIIEGALAAFAPDLLVVDKVALGVRGELEPALRTLRALGTTRTVLGLREVLDTPEVAVREWEAAATTDAVEAYYDEVWVYGDPDVYDPVAEYSLPAAVAAKVRYTGYLGHGRTTGTRTRTRPTARIRPPAQPYVLCLVGGGQDGHDLADAFVHAPLPAGHAGVVLTGPFMRREVREHLRAVAAAQPGMTLLEFVPDADEFIAGAAAVVSMAGYNSVCELLAARARTLLAPRINPRAEQLVRAARLAELGLVDVVEPHELTPAAVAAWTAAAVHAGRPHGAEVDLDGLRRVPTLAAALAFGPAPEAVPSAA